MALTISVQSVYGWQSTLYLFDNKPPYIYSDMNGYRHFAPALSGRFMYLLPIAACLGVVSIGLVLRAAVEGCSARLRLLRQRAPRRISAAILFILIAVGGGSWYFYKTRLFNEFLSG